MQVKHQHTSSPGGASASWDDGRLQVTLGLIFVDINLGICK